MKKNDIILIAVVLAVAAILYFSGILGAGKTGGKAVIYIDGEKYQEINLDEDGEYTFKTEAGTNILEIKDGQASMIYADCRDKICVNHSPISKENESITCLPHKLVIEITGAEKNHVDAVVQ